MDEAAATRKTLSLFFDKMNQHVDVLSDAFGSQEKDLKTLGCLPASETDCSFGIFLVIEMRDGIGWCDTSTDSFHA